jgi:hypothetical protein
VVEKAKPRSKERAIKEPDCIPNVPSEDIIEGLGAQFA